MIHLPHSGVGVKEIEEKRKQKNHADFGPKPDAEPDDEKRRQGGARDAVQGDDDRLEDFSEQPAAPERSSPTRCLKLRRWEIRWRSLGR